MDLPPTLLAAWCLLLCLIVFRWIVLPAFFSPLAKLPNAHWSAPFSVSWIFYKRVLQKDTLAVHDAHERLGPIVRLAPHDVSVNSLEGLRTIYGGAYEKNDWYHNIFSNYGIRPMFTMSGNKEHGQRKKALGNVYSKSVLLSNPDLRVITKSLVDDRFVPLLNGMAKSGQAVDFYDTTFAWSVDFVTAYLFGLKASSKLLSQPELARTYFRSYKALVKGVSMPQEFPRLTHVLGRSGVLARILPPQIADWDREAYILGMQDAAEEVVLTAAEEDKYAHKGEWPTVYAQLRASLLANRAIPSKDNDPTSQSSAAGMRLEIASEMADHTIAGLDTSSTALSFLIWELSKPENAAWQNSLRDEFAQVAEISDAKAVDKLPILEAAIKETLRLHPPVGGNLVRVTPNHKPRIFDIPGRGAVELPPNTRIHAQAWSLHRNPDVFPHPETWNPERWLSSTAEELKEMNRWFWAFGSGPRMCTGNNFAMIELKAMAASLWRGFRTELVDGKGMVQNTGFIGGPLGFDGSYLKLRLFAVDSI